MEDLIEFPIDIIVEACRQWRRKPGGRRPTPGDIRAICIEERALRTPLLEHRSALTEDEIMAAANTWAKSHKFASIEDFQRRGGTVNVSVGNGSFRTFGPLPASPKLKRER